MKISVDTEIEEMAELRAAVAIIEDAIKRRENGEDISETQTTVNEVPQVEETPEPQEPVEEEPAPQVEPKEEPSVDLSALSTSDYGERVENRSMDEPTSEPEPEPEPPQQNNKEIVRDIIQSLKDKNQGGPIQMQEIVQIANGKDINEEETRTLVQELQKESSI